MKDSKHKILGFLLILVLLLTAFIDVNAQIINKYAKVLTVYNTDPTDPDSVKVDSAQFFNTYDTVLFIITKGATAYGPWNDYPFPDDWGRYYDYHNMGRYNILLVDTVDLLNNIVVFSTKLRDLYPPIP